MTPWYAVMRAPPSYEHPPHERHEKSPAIITLFAHRPSQGNPRPPVRPLSIDPPHAQATYHDGTCSYDRVGCTVRSLSRPSTLAGKGLAAHHLPCSNRAPDHTFRLGKCRCRGDSPISGPPRMKDPAGAPHTPRPSPRRTPLPPTTTPPSPS
eukprot:scaffold259042_cov31-Tisochrysis_lutea.AAC.2